MKLLKYSILQFNIKRPTWNYIDY